MASSDDKITSDAKRASTRGFGGYLADRALGRADFEDKKAPATKAGAQTLGGGNKDNKDALEAAGMKRGGLVKRPAAKAPAKKAVKRGR
jgi:hypothetical protein